MASRKPRSIRTDKYIYDANYKWNITSDVTNNNFEPLVHKIIILNP